VGQLIVVGFTDRFRAAEVLNDLKRRDLGWTADLDHAVVVTLDETGKVKVQLNVDLSVGQTAAWAELWGSLLGVTLFLRTANLTQAADRIRSAPENHNNGSGTGDTASNANWWKRDVGLGEQFLRDMGALIKDGGSAIFMLLHTEENLLVRKELQNYGSMIIHTMLSAEQLRKISEFFALT
jgi:uncharacterized membrane protein